MATPRSLPHIVVTDRVQSGAYKPSTSRSKRPRDIDPREHGAYILAAIHRAFDEEDLAADTSGVAAELRSIGNIITFRSAPGFEIDFGPVTPSDHANKWQILNIKSSKVDDQQVDDVTVWIAHKARAQFLKRYEEYASGATTGRDNPKRGSLVANTADVRRALLEDLWTSLTPPEIGRETWWTLLLDRERLNMDVLKSVVTANGMRLSQDRIVLDDTVIVIVKTIWDRLGRLLMTQVPLLEIRRTQRLEDRASELDPREQSELVADLIERITPAPLDAPVVCHLDSGVRHSHHLLRESLADGDWHVVVGQGPTDALSHGTKMAGLALYGPHLDDLLLSNADVRLHHRLESVKILSDSKSAENSQEAATTTVHAIAPPEARHPERPRVFCMPVSLPDPEARPGEPTLWSATVDALAAGVSVDPNEQGRNRADAPDPGASRLFIVSAGNVDTNAQGYNPHAYLDSCRHAPIEDPGQAWNALTVGAYTDMAEAPSDPGARHAQLVAPPGGLSPFSRTSHAFSTSAPIKPEICMEGGNLYIDPVAGSAVTHDSLSLTTTHSRYDEQLASANATSAATAQAARLAAMTMSKYPDLWPETVRGLLVHEAQWTPAMKDQLNRTRTKTARLDLLKFFGWGVPEESHVLSSSHHAVTLIIQDQFTPLRQPRYSFAGARLHHLPWPTEVLQNLGDERVRVRVTLSYFIEPSVRRLGWSNRYAYASLGLRFQMQAPNEPALDDFLLRVRMSEEEQTAERAAYSDSGRWLLGKNSRDRGSLRQDEWTATAQEAAACQHIAVQPTGGWWKNNKRKDRLVPVRYALIVSLTALDSETDLYTPIYNELSVPVEVAAPSM